MIKSNEATALTNSYFEKGNVESKAWLDAQLVSVEKSIREAAVKGNVSCEVEIEFENDDPWQLARTKLISAFVEKEMGFAISVSLRSRQVNDVLKKPVTHLAISW